MSESFFVEPQVNSLAWNQSYSVKVNCLDDDHKRLLSLINKLHESIEKGDAGWEVLEILQELEHYAIYHFAAEEAMLAKAEYPGLAAHRIEHRRLVKEMLEMKAAVLNRGGQVFNLVEFLNGWLTNHIVGTDKQYSEHLNSRGIF